MLLFKFTNGLIYVPNQYLPVLSPVTSTRANHPFISMPEQTVTENSFLPRTVKDWNDLEIENLNYIDGNFKLLNVCELSFLSQPQHISHITLYKHIMHYQ